MIRLRKFTTEDADRVQIRIYPNMTNLQIREMIREWNAGVFAGKRFHMFAVTLCDEPVGTVSLYEQEKNVASLGVEIAKDYRGQGIAAEASKQALCFAAELGYSKVVSQVRQDNAASIALHRKLGFTLVAETVNQKGNPVFCYEKCV